MGFTKRLGSGVLAAVLMLSAGCDDATTPDGDTPGRRFEAVPHAAPLSRALPSETIAYVRIPSLADWLFRPNEDALHAVQAADAHAQLAERIRQGLRQNVARQLEAPAAAIAELLIHAHDSPLELAFLEPPDASLVPNVLIRTQVRADDAQPFPELLEALSAAHPQLRVFSPMDGEGFGSLMAGPMPVYFHYRADDDRLLMLSGISASAELLKTKAAGGYETTGALQEFEAAHDASGRHPAAWIDFDRWWPKLRSMQPPEQARMMEQAGLGAIDFIWMGGASRGGRAETVLHVQMPPEGFRRLLPVIGAGAGFRTAGPPDAAIRFTLPSSEQVDALIEWIALFVPQAQADVEAAERELKASLGFDWRLVLRALGPDITLVNDQAGWWAAVRLRDEQVYGRLKGELAQLGLIGLEPVAMAGLEMERIRSGSLLGLSDDSEGEGNDLPPVLAGALRRIGSRAYVLSEGDVLVVASLPQILADRGRLEAADFHAWLSGLGLSWDHALFGAVKEIDRSPRELYYFYLKSLALLADVADVEIDLTSFPSALELELPAAGRFGAQLSSTPDALVARLSYEASPLEALLGGNAFATTAIAGMLAAIAIPAYADYTVRAQVAEGLNAAAAQKLAVAEYYFMEGRLPGAGELASPPPGQWWTLAIGPDASIEIRFVAGAHEQLAGRAVVLTPVPGDDALHWECSSPDIEPKHLPASCR